MEEPGSDTRELWRRLVEQQREIERLKAKRQVGLLGRVLAIFSIVVGLAGVGSVAHASIPSTPDDIIHGCYNKKTGALRVIDTQKKPKPQTCRASEGPLSWNQKGPKGDTGPAGSGGSGGGSGAWTKIDTVKLDSAQSSVSFSSILQTYTHLKLLVSTRSDDTDDLSELLICRFNGDADAHYGWADFTTIGSSTGEQPGDQSNGIVVGSISGSAVSGGSLSATEVLVSNYTSSTQAKGVLGSSGYFINVNNGIGMFSGGGWNSTSPVTSITLQPGIMAQQNILSPKGKFVAGSIFTLYGVST